MKTLTLLFLIFIGNIISSQNYHYALDEAPRAADNETPSVPQNLIATNVTKTTVDLSWDAATDNIRVVNYSIYNNGNLLRQAIGNVTNYTLVSLTPETTYNLTVRALDEARNESDDSNAETITTLGYGENMIDEIAYFDAYLLPLSEKNLLQQALDEHGAVRLESGNYNGPSITLTSGQRLYGYPDSKTYVPQINIAAGADGVIIDEVNPRFNNIEFLAGSPITNSILKSINGNSSGSYIVAKNSRLENNLFVNLRSRIDFDNSSSGYFRNNTFVRHQVQSWSLYQTKKVGNTTEPSYGDVHIFTNHLTPDKATTYFDNLQSLTLIGIDAEGWNQRGGNGDDKALLDMYNMGEVRIGDFQGGNGYYFNNNTQMTEAFSIDAKKTFMMNKTIVSIANAPGGKAPPSSINGSGDFMLIKALNNLDPVDFKSTGNDFRFHQGDGDNNAFYNGVAQNAPINGTNASNLNNFITGMQRKPFERPYWEILPDPNGPSWKSERDRTEQTDSREYIQNLIDSNDIAELPEGTYYIGSSLRIASGQGIVGAGTGKTAIVGLTDDFSLIVASDDEDKVVGPRFRLAHLTLQGGNTGLEFDTYAFQITQCTFKYLIFRDQNYGIHLNRSYALDNNFFDHVNFVNCNIGFFQDPLLPRPTNDGSDPRNDRGAAFRDTAYIDKCLFYHCQVINCGVGFYMKGDRANNMNAWVDCLFDGNGTHFEGDGRSMFFANCDFINAKGDYAIGGFSTLSFYSCNFNNNSVTNVLNLSMLYAEGCNFNDSVPINKSNGYDWQKIGGIIVNSKVRGPFNGINYGMLINSSFEQNPELNNMLVKIEYTGELDGEKTVLLDTQPIPYPQFLVKY